jgi:transcriptional regulator with XRE-family HTH domain
MHKEKLRSIRIKKGFTQKQIAEALSTDPSNYSRKENGEVRIVKDEWDKLAKFMDVPLEEIYEEDEAKVIINNDHPVFNDSPASASYINQFNSIPNSIVENLQDYILLLKEENKKLKERIKDF